MSILPQPARKRQASYLPPHKRRCAPIPARSFPEGVRIGTDSWSAYHEFLQHDGRWIRCGGRGRCRECIREEEGKSVEQRVREALTGRLDIEALMTIGAREPLFGTIVADRESNRVEALIAVNYEFQISLPGDVIDGVVTLDGLIDAVGKWGSQ